MLLDLWLIERNTVRKSNDNKDILRKYSLAIRRLTKKLLDKIVGGVVHPIICDGRFE
jgi:hypothetical protein